MRISYTFIFLLFLHGWVQAQDRPVALPSRAGGGRSGGNLPSNIGGKFSGAFGGGGGRSIDSLEHRDKYEDSITIFYQLPASVQSNQLDSTINDFTKRFPIPAHHIFLGNNGNATKSILFSPEMKSGWDHGMHAFDVYRWKPEAIRFFNTTRPYTEMAYLLGGRTEQVIEITHTQNLQPNWNALLQYRLINAPGFFKNQKTNHNNYLFTSWYQSVNKRYNNYLALLGNSMQSAENGGLKEDQDYLNIEIFNDRFAIPTNLGGDVEFGRNFFSSKLNTGNRYKDFSFIVRQQYDLGKRDSLVSDSTVIPLFYPRLRFEHLFQYNTYDLKFIDQPNFQANVPYFPDSVFYQDVYGYTLLNDSILLQDKWKEVINEFSIYQYPDARNLLQFLKAGIQLQNLKAETEKHNGSFYNLSVMGEYRNKTRNKKWDMTAAGKLFLNGLNAGDYDAHINLKRISVKTGGYIDVGFSNMNKTPAFVFDRRSSFYVAGPVNFNKENVTRLWAAVYYPKFNLKLSGNYYLISNYTYFARYTQPGQAAALFNLIRISLEKKIRLGKRWIWHSDIHFQKKTGDAPVNLPLLFTRNRVGYEGTLGFRKLNIAIGLEIKYHSPYKADGYSPMLGKFFYQDSIKITNRPDASFYLHFRIRNFRTFFRVENLNAITTTNGFGFRYHNFAAAGYPYPGMNLRVGIYWSFVN